jgi:hypothetical protein
MRTFYHMRHVCVIIGTALALAGCNTTSDVAPLNYEASKGPIPKIELLGRGWGGGPFRVTMPDGEILTGRYVAPRTGGSVGFGTIIGPKGATSVSTFTSGTSGPFAAQATGSHGATIACQGSYGGMDGSAICETNRGAQYQILF